MPNLLTSKNKLVEQRAREYTEHLDNWRFLLDSYEGGDQYRYAVYGPNGGKILYNSSYEQKITSEVAGRERYETVSKQYQLNRHNLVRHPREYPDPREPDNAIDDYQTRLDRTPVPTFVSQAIRKHLSRIYAHEVSRGGPKVLVDWWKDVDGCRCSIDKWMRKTVAPLLLVLGQLDLIFDHPPAPDGEPVGSKAVADRLGLTSCVAGYILPQNMLWWRLLPNGLYAECLVREHHDDPEGGQESLVRYRHWTETGSTLYGEDGKATGAERPHPFGRVPIRRVFDERKLRCRNVGQSRYEAIAERQREAYNEMSELILTNTLQAHPQLQGPAEYLSGDQTVPIGPNRILPKWFDDKTGQSDNWEVLSFPKDGAQFLRQSVLDNRDEADRDAALTKPAGATEKGTVAQSGLSKSFDFQEGNNLLSEIAETLADAERVAAEYALIVLTDGKVRVNDQSAITVVYPRKFDLQTASDLAEVFERYQRLVQSAGNLPSIEADALRDMTRLMLPGRTDEEYAAYSTEILAWVDNQNKRGPIGVPMQPGSPGVLGGKVKNKDVAEDGATDDDGKPPPKAPDARPAPTLVVAGSQNGSAGG
jgi:hypothetical protein